MQKTARYEYYSTSHWYGRRTVLIVLYLGNAGTPMPVVLVVLPVPYLANNVLGCKSLQLFYICWIHDLLLWCQQICWLSICCIITGWLVFVILLLLDQKWRLLLLLVIVLLLNDCSSCRRGEWWKFTYHRKWYSQTRFTLEPSLSQGNTLHSFNLASITLYIKLICFHWQQFVRATISY